MGGEEEEDREVKQEDRGLEGDDAVEENEREMEDEYE